MAMAAAELAVVMDRMIVAGGRLEGQELRLGHRARRDVEGLAEGEVLEVERRGGAVAGGIEGERHEGCPWPTASKLSWSPARRQEAGCRCRYGCRHRQELGHAQLAIRLISVSTLARDGLVDGRALPW